LTQTDTPARREERAEVTLPVQLTLQLTAESEESIPAMLVNVSASGILALADVRFSPLLPPHLDMIFKIAFFLEEIEVREVKVRVERIAQRGPYTVELGCAFCDLPDATRIMLRHKIAAQSAKPKM
jgi:hypothetical protein